VVSLHQLHHSVDSVGYKAVEKTLVTGTIWNTVCYSIQTILFQKDTGLS